MGLCVHHHRRDYSECITLIGLPTSGKVNNHITSFNTDNYILLKGNKYASFKKNKAVP